METSSNPEAPPARRSVRSRDSLVGQRMGFWFELMALIASSMAALRQAAHLELRPRIAYVADMRILVLRRLLIVLTGISFLVGAAVPAMPRAEFMASDCMDAAQTATGDCCAKMTMEDPATPAPMKQVPCKGISLDCANQPGCISSPTLPAPAIALGTPTVYGRVAYLPLAASRAGLSIKPDLFPPIPKRAGV